MKSQRVVLVEGFLDRAFVAGLLKRLGCRSLGASGKPPPQDPWGADVKGGQYAFGTRSDAFIRLAAIGHNKFEKQVRLFSTLSKTQPVERLLIVPDADLPAGTDVTTFLQSKCAALANLCAGTQSSDSHFTSDSIPAGHVGVWSAADSDPRLPPNQTLERLVCAATAAARPLRFENVRTFLDGRAEAPPRTGKEEAMALMAGWLSSRYSEGFFEAVWEDEMIATELERRLRTTSTFEAFELVAS